MDKVRLSHWLLCIIIVFIGIAVGSTLVIGFGFGLGVMIVLQIRKEAIKAYEQQYRAGQFDTRR